MRRSELTWVMIVFLILGASLGIVLGLLLANADEPQVKWRTEIRHESTTNQPIIHNKTYPTKHTHSEHTTQMPCKLPDTGGG